VGLLTERQTIILKYLYDEERDVSEVAQLLKIDAQTVRSTHHKALLRLRDHFKEEMP
jgi:DNA-directed RNA polymerase specialized sigma subunit